MAGPALAVAGRGQQTIDGTLEDEGRGASGLTVAQGKGVAGDGGVEIAGESLGLGVGGREAVEVVGQATQQRLAVGGGVGLEPGRVKLGQDESVDLVLAPSRVAELRRDGKILDGLERPVVARLLRETGQLGRAADGGRRAHLNPLLQGRNLRITELGARLAGRHGELGVALVDRDEQQGLLEVTRHDRRPLVAAGEQGRPRVQH